MKRFVSILLTLLLVLSIPTFVLAQETPDGFQYRVEKDESITITGYSGKDNDFSIPGEIDGKSVTAIGNGAFMEKETIKHVIVSEGIRKIGNGAFSRSNNLVSIVLPSTVYMIGEGAFEYCQSLQKVNIPEGVVEIPARAFAGSRNIESIDIPSTVEIIGDYAFGNTAFSSIDLPFGLKKIDHNAFGSCSLVNVIVPNTVKEIGPNAFWDSKQLVTVIFPSGLKNIKFGTFSQDGALEKVTIPKSVTSITESAISNCYKLNIWGFKGSTAETFAKKNNIPFVTVDPVKEVRILSNNEDVTKGKLFIDLNIDTTSMQLTAQTTPENPWPGVTWKSSDAKVASVDANGLVIGLKKGKATITATAVDGSGKKATCEITVANLAKEINITGENTVKAGKKLKLTATVLPETTTSKKLEWTTSDKTIASVDTSGTVTAKKINEEKTVTITATAKDGSGVFTELIITIVP